jgi:hypothetical protein
MIHELNESERINIEDAWEGKSGVQVEDAITRSITTLNDKAVSSISYDATSQEL